MKNSFVAVWQELRVRKFLAESGDPSGLRRSGEQECSPYT